MLTLAYILLGLVVTVLGVVVWRLGELIVQVEALEGQEILLTLEGQGAHKRIDALCHVIHDQADTIRAMRNMDRAGPGENVFGDLPDHRHDVERFFKTLDARTNHEDECLCEICIEDNNPYDTD